MKTTILKLTAFLLFLPVFFSCENKDHPEAEPCECQFEDPLNDLPWLKAIVEKFEEDAAALGCNQYAGIYRCTYKDGTGFLLKMCDGCHRGTEYSFRNDEGAVLWEEVEFPREDTCPELGIDFETMRLIWEKEETLLYGRYNLNIREVSEDRTVYTDNGARHLVSNESYQSDKTEAAEIALAYLNAKRDEFKLSSNPGDIKVLRVQKFSDRTDVFFEQYLNNIPVYSTLFEVRLNEHNTVVYARNEFRNAPDGPVDSIPAITDAEALRNIHKCLSVNFVYGDEMLWPLPALHYFESIDKGFELAWTIRHAAAIPGGPWLFFVSAIDGHIIHMENIYRDW